MRQRSCWGHLPLQPGHSLLPCPCLPLYPPLEGQVLRPGCGHCPVGRHRAVGAGEAGVPGAARGAHHRLVGVVCHACGGRCVRAGCGGAGGGLPGALLRRHGADAPLPALRLLRCAVRCAPMMFVVTMPPATILGRMSNRSALMMMLRRAAGAQQRLSSGGCGTGRRELKAPHAARPAAHSWFHMAAARLCSHGGLPCARQAGAAAPISASSRAARWVCRSTVGQCVGGERVAAAASEWRRLRQASGGGSCRARKHDRKLHSLQPHPGRHDGGQRQRGRS